MKNVFHRAISILLVALCLFGLSVPLGNVVTPPAFAAAQKAQVGEIYIVNVTRLNVRSGPNVKASVKTRLKKGVEVTYRKSEKGWWYVDYPKGSGYVDGKFLKKKAATSENTDGSGEKATHRTICKLRMREKPSLKGKVIGTLRKGARVRVMSQNGEWSEIGYKGKKVWVATRYLKKRS